MEILSFQQFKLLLEAEAEGDLEKQETETPAEPVEPPAPEEAPAEPTPAEPAAADAGSTSAPSMPSAPPSDPFAYASLPPDPNAPVATPQVKPIRFVLLDSDKEWHSTYDAGGGVKRFNEYEIEVADLEKWIDENGYSAEKDSIMKAFQGKKSLSSAVYNKLKSALRKESIGKDRGDIDIEYDDKLVPSTSDLNVVFVKHSD